MKLLGAQVLFILLMLTVVNGRPSSKETKSQEELELQLQDMIEVNGEIYVRKPMSNKRDSKKVKNQEKKQDNVVKVQEKVVNDVKKMKYIEGDIIPSKYIKELRSVKIKRNIMKGDAYKWKNRKYFYQLDPSLTDQMKSDIKDAIKTLSLISCLDFINGKDKDGYVLFRKSPADENSCDSYIGRTGQQGQVVNVATWCNSGKLQHEILHSLGFLHEHSRPDRDDYVTINWENIKPGYQTEFKKYEHPKVQLYKEPYDYDSIMHYGKTFFSKNGKSTIVPKKWFTFIGGKTNLSKSDIKLLNLHYGCRKCENTGWGCWAKKYFDCDRATSSCLGSCGAYCMGDLNADKWSDNASSGPQKFQALKGLGWDDELISMNIET